MYVLLNVGCRANLSDKANNVPFPFYRNEAEQPCCKEHNVFPCCYYFSCVSPVGKMEFYKNIVCEAWCKEVFVCFFSNFPVYVVYKRKICFVLQNWVAVFWKPTKSVLTFWLPGSLWYLKRDTFLCVYVGGVVAFMGQPVAPRLCFTVYSRVRWSITMSWG